MPNGKTDYSKLSWAEWKGAIGNRVKTTEQNVDKLFDLIGKHDRALAYIQGRAAAFGAIGGGVVALILLIIKTIWTIKSGN